MSYSQEGELITNVNFCGSLYAFENQLGKVGYQRQTICHSKFTLATDRDRWNHKTPADVIDMCVGMTYLHSIDSSTLNKHNQIKLYCVFVLFCVVLTIIISDYHGYTLCITPIQNVVAHKLICIIYAVLYIWCRVINCLFEKYNAIHRRFIFSWWRHQMEKKIHVTGTFWRNLGVPSLEINCMWFGIKYLRYLTDTLVAIQPENLLNSKSDWDIPVSSYILLQNRVGYENHGTKYKPLIQNYLG